MRKVPLISAMTALIAKTKKYKHWRRKFKSLKTKIHVTRDEIQVTEDEKFMSPATKIQVIGIGDRDLMGRVLILNISPVLVLIVAGAHINCHRCLYFLSPLPILLVAAAYTICRICLYLLDVTYNFCDERS